MVDYFKQIEAKAQAKTNITVICNFLLSDIIYMYVVILTIIIDNGPQLATEKVKGFYQLQGIHFNTLSPN